MPHQIKRILKDDGTQEEEYVVCINYEKKEKGSLIPGLGVVLFNYVDKYQRSKVMTCLDI